MKRVVFFVAIVTVAMATDLSAQCSLNLQKTDLGRGKAWELSWNTVPGIDDYKLELIRTDDETGTTTTRVRELDSRGAAKMKEEVSILTTVDLDVTYRVTAIGTPEPCSATIAVSYPNDADFRRIVRKSVIPLVGSTRGAGGSLFKTSLRLRATKTNQRGTIVFHPANAEATNNDPRLDYTLPTLNSIMEWDDVVAALGVNGIGTLDIVPDGGANGWSVPAADVRLFNVAANGTYGATAIQTQAYDYLSASPDPLNTLTVTVPAIELRLNLAVRTFDAARTTIDVRRDGSKISTRRIDSDRETLLFDNAPNLTGFALQPGDVITITVSEGGGIPMYTLTDNQTNDPALYVPPTRVRYDVEAFDVGF